VDGLDDPEAASADGSGNRAGDSANHGDRDGDGEPGPCGDRCEDGDRKVHPGIGVVGETGFEAHVL